MLPRIGVTYQPIQPLTFYASWSRSFSPTLAAQFTPGGQPFQPEYGHQYEAGVRTSELHGRLSSSLAFYRIRASNLLITNPGNPLASIQIGTTESKGIEVDTSGRILPGWDITFAYAYNEARIVADPVYPVGNTFQNAPRHSGSVWTVYELQHGPLSGLSLEAVFKHAVTALSIRQTTLCFLDMVAWMRWRVMSLVRLTRNRSLQNKCKHSEPDKPALL